MPCSINHLARSGWSEGPWPQIPTYLPFSLQALIAMASSFFTAGLRSSNKCATMPESRSKPSVNWVRSFEPMEKPSKYSRNSSANRALAGNSHIMMTFKPSGCSSPPRCKPLAASRSTTSRASSVVRTNGTMISTLVSPMSSRTRFSARHSSSKQGRNASEI